MTKEYKLSELELVSDKVVIKSITHIENKIIEALEQKDFSDIFKEWYVPLEIFIKLNSNFDYLEYNGQSYDNWYKENRNIYNYKNVPEKLENEMINKKDAEDILKKYRTALNLELGSDSIDSDLEKEIISISELIEEPIIKFIDNKNINEYPLLDLLKDVQYRWNSVFYNHLYLNMHEYVSKYAKDNDLRFTRDGEVILNHENEKSDTYHF